MGCVSIATVVLGRRVLGIVPSAFLEKNLIGKTCGKELKVATMHEQLLKMMEFVDAFIRLPAGFDTLEELFQIVSWAQLNIHQKPIDGDIVITGKRRKQVQFDERSSDMPDASSAGKGHVGIIKAHDLDKSPSDQNLGTNKESFSKVMNDDSE
ncbi:hypothetical protein DITRI_Ditri01bG0127200 [Diplodiscus trichospermus]